MREPVAADARRATKFETRCERAGERAEEREKGMFLVASKPQLVFD